MPKPSSNSSPSLGTTIKEWSKRNWLLILAGWWLIGAGLVLGFLDGLANNLPKAEWYVPAWVVVLYVVVFLVLVLGWLLNTGRQYGFLTALITFYLVGVVCLAFWTINNNLPSDNLSIHSFSTLTTTRQVDYLEQLTISELTVLHRAQDAITRWQSPGGTSLVTAVDQADISAGLALAAQLTNNLVTVTVGAYSGTNTVKTQLLTNNFAISNWSGKAGMSTTLLLTQSSLTITTNFAGPKIPPQTTISQSPVLLLNGDLRQVTASQLRNASSQLGIAIGMLDARHNFLATHFWPPGSDVIKNFYASPGIPPLTPVEVQNLQTQVQNSLPVAGQFNLFLLFLAFGALGSCVKLLASLVRYLGMERFKPSWAAYYFLHPLVGALLAVIFYLIFKSGISSALSTTTPNLDTFGYCAIAVLVGMFSDEATVKLEKIATGLLADNTSKDDDEISSDLSILGVRIAGQPDLTVANITDLPGLVKLFQAQTPGNAALKMSELKTTADLTKFLLGGLSGTTQHLLSNYISGNDQQLAKALVDDLNGLIKANLLYQAPLFNTFHTPEVDQVHNLVYGTTVMPINGPVLTGIWKLNRWLVAWAYADYLACWVITLQGSGLRADTIISMDGKSLPNNETAAFTKGQLQFKLKITDHEPGTVALSLQNPAPNPGQSSEFDIGLA